MERKRNKIFKGSLLLAAFLCLLWTCRDKENEPDPCISLSPTSAEFKTSSNLLYFRGSPALKVVVTDTFRVDENVDFTASDTTAESYAWKVGLDARTFTAKKFRLYFDKAYGKINISLVVTKKPNLTCFPSDKGVDTVKKSIYILDPNEIPLVGSYFGADTTQPDKKYTLKFYYKSGYSQYFIDKFPNICDTLGIWVKDVAYNEFSLDYGGGVDGEPNIYRPLGCQVTEEDGPNKNRGWLSADKKTLTIQYFVGAKLNDKTILVKRKFIGQRIN